MHWRFDKRHHARAPINNGDPSVDWTLSPMSFSVSFNWLNGIRLLASLLHIHPRPRQTHTHTLTFRCAVEAVYLGYITGNLFTSILHFTLKPAALSSSWLCSVLAPIKVIHHPSVTPTNHRSITHNVKWKPCSRRGTSKGHHVIAYEIWLLQQMHESNAPLSQALF